MSSTPALTRNLFIIAALWLIIAACTPRIYSFTVEPRMIGQTDTLHIQWAARGKVFLKVQDYPYPAARGADVTAPAKDSVKLPALTLLLTRGGRTTAVTLHPNTGIQWPLPCRDSLTLHKQPDSNSGNILRYIVLSASLRGKAVDSVLQIEIRTDSATAQIAFAPVIVGDSLVASGINDTVRWDGVFSVLTVAAGSTRSLTVTHAGFTRVLTPGQQPDTSFRGAPIKGEWAINSPLTADEKDDHSLIPRFLRITITIKHR